MNACLALIALLLSISQGARADDDPPKATDEPKTELMDFWVTQGELSIGSGLYSGFNPFVEGRINLGRVSKHFHWQGIIDVDLSLNALKDFDWRGVDVRLGGRWSPGTSSFERSEYSSDDHAWGIGVEVFSFDQGGQPASITDDGTNPLTTDDLIRYSLRGVIATGGFASLSQKRDEKSNLFEFSMGAGTGLLEMHSGDIPVAEGMGGVFHIRAQVQIINEGSYIRCDWTQLVGDEIKGGNISVIGNLDVGAFNIFGGMKYFKVDTEENPDRHIRSELIKIFLGFGVSLEDL